VVSRRLSTVAEAFGANADPDYGWNIQLRDGRYVGSLGRVRSSGEPATTRIKIRDLAVTVALDAMTGRTLWTRPRSSVFCGQLRFDLAHPVVCDGTGRSERRRHERHGTYITLAGIDPATGKNRWQARVSAPCRRIRHAGSRKRIHRAGRLVRPNVNGWLVPAVPVALHTRVDVEFLED
jgi:hypothetical protein